MHTLYPQHCPEHLTSVCCHCQLSPECQLLPECQLSSGCQLSPECQLSLECQTLRLLQMANNLEGGGRTPLLSPEQLQDLGFAIVAYPLSLVGVATAAMQTALRGLREGHMPQPNTLPAFKVMT